MKFSFDESEVLNYYIEQENIKEKKLLIRAMDDTLNNSEDKELIEICKSIKKKINDINENQYNNLVTNLPVDTISIY